MATPAPISLYPAATPTTTAPVTYPSRAASSGSTTASTSTTPTVSWSGHASVPSAAISTPKFDWKASDRFKAWTDFLLGCHAVFDCPGYNHLTHRDRIRMMLQWMGPKARMDYMSWSQAARDEMDENMNLFLEKWATVWRPESTSATARITFSSAKRKQKQSAVDYLHYLQMLAMPCAFKDSDERIRDQFVQGINDEAMQNKMLEEIKDETTATELCNLCKRIESVRSQQGLLRGDTVDSVTSDQRSRSRGRGRGRGGRGRGAARGRGRRNSRSKSRDPTQGCDYCGRKHERKQCPAWGQTCNTCGKRNHFSNVCKSGESSKARLNPEVPDAVTKPQVHQEAVAEAVVARRKGSVHSMMCSKTTTGLIQIHVFPYRKGNTTTTLCALKVSSSSKSPSESSKNCFH